MTKSTKSTCGHMVRQEVLGENTSYLTELLSQNIVFVVNMQSDKIGGLFLATYERINRIQYFFNSCVVINCSAYDTVFVRLLKHIFCSGRCILRKKPETEAYRGITINNLNHRRSVIYYIRRALQPSACEQMEAWYLINKYQKEINKSSLIHAHWGWPQGFYASVIAAKYALPYYITFHGSDIGKAKRKNLPFLLTSMKNANRCFFVSQQLLKEAKQLGYEGDNASVSYNGVDTEVFNPANYPARRMDTRTLGFVGALREVKGVYFLPEIFLKVKQCYEKCTKFLIVGEGELIEWLKSSCRKHGLSVQFTGAVRPLDVPSYLSKMDVLVVPSIQEGLGMVILEANALGIPAVGTKTGGIPEAIGFSENIIPHSEQMVDQIAHRIIQLFDEQVDAAKYRQRVVENHSWAQVVMKEMDIYSKCFNNKNGRPKETV